MAGLVIGSDVVVVEPPAPPAAGVQDMTWTGYDGTTFDLLNAENGVFVTNGIRGLSMPPHTRMTAEAAGVAGSRWTGHRTLERPVFWPVFIYADGSSQWAEVDRAWWATMRPDQVGTWAVTGPLGETRTLRLRYEDDSDHSFYRDPSVAGWEVYGVNLVAEDPYWAGAPVVNSWEAATSTPFFPGPPFTLGSSHTLDTATMTNAGDVDAYPVWRINGGSVTNAEVGVAGRVIEVPISLGPGQWLVIDTDPTAQTVIDQDGVDRTAELGEADFAPIHPGESVPLSLTMTGAGSVSATLVPRYLRAW